MPLPISFNPFRKKTEDEINPYTVEIDLSDSIIKKVKKLSPTSAKFIFDCSKPFHVDVKFETFSLESLKSNFNNNNFKFKKFFVVADFEKEDYDWLMEQEENPSQSLEDDCLDIVNQIDEMDEAKKSTSIIQKISKSLRLKKLFNKIKDANEGFKYKNKRGKSTISFSYGGRHARKFIPLPKNVYLHCTVDFSNQYQLNIGGLRPMNTKDAKAKKENRVYFKCPDLAKAIVKAIKFKALGKPIKEELSEEELAEINFERNLKKFVQENNKHFNKEPYK